jgi:Putative addiction module component
MDSKVDSMMDSSTRRDHDGRRPSPRSDVLGASLRSAWLAAPRRPGLAPRVSAGLDASAPQEQAWVMATVHQVIELAAQLSEEERRVVVDAIAPKESLEELARAWGEEIDRRAARVRAGETRGRTADKVFDDIGAKLRSR